MCRTSRCPSRRGGRPMRLGESANLQAAINITPLVDVVLVLLIIFMVVAPPLRKGYDVNIPTASAAADHAHARGSLLVSIVRPGRCYVNNQRAADGQPADGH